MQNKMHKTEVEHHNYGCFIVFFFINPPLIHLLWNNYWILFSLSKKLLFLRGIKNMLELQWKSNWMLVQEWKWKGPQDNPHGAWWVCLQLSSAGTKITILIFVQDTKNCPQWWEEKDNCERAEKKKYSRYSWTFLIR